MKSNDFVVYQHSEGTNVITVSGNEADIEGGFFDTWPPLGPLDILQIEVGSDFNLSALNERIAFTLDQFPQGEDFTFETLSSDDNSSETHELHFFEGEVFRRAVVIQGGKVWQIVGHLLDGNVVTLLHELEGRDLGFCNVAGASEIASFEWHSDGPGPISWDGSQSISSVGGCWLFFESGDSSSRYELSPRPTDHVSAIREWLEEVSALNLFIVQEVESNWISPTFRGRLDHVISQVKKFAELNLSVDESTIQALVDEVRKMSSDLDGVATILEQTAHPQAEQLLALLEEDVGGFPFWSSGEIIPALKHHANKALPPV